MLGLFRIMEEWGQPVLLLWLASVAATTILGANTKVVEDDALVRNVTSTFLHVIPSSSHGSSVTKLVIEGSQITLNESDRLALASYPRLVELHLDGNLVSRIPAQYFSVVPHLRVLTLSRNRISSLHPDSFSGLDALTELDLSYNLLTGVPPHLFRPLTNLQVLKLQGNRWNCSCLLLSGIAEVQAAGQTVGGNQITCASPEKQAGKDVLQAAATCYATPPSGLTLQKPVNSQNSLASSTTPQTTRTSNQTHDIKRVQTPVLGNTWKFAACVAGLALSTSVLIVCAVRGPSLYKLFHNYRHRRLRQDEEDAVSTVFSETERNVNRQTFTFQQDGQMEEEEDGYFEDLYIKSEE
ncbi:leucine-rich repeat-containing protein 19-like [Spinachia spinachia]